MSKKCLFRLSLSTLFFSFIFNVNALVDYSDYERKKGASGNKKRFKKGKKNRGTSIRKMDSQGYTPSGLFDIETSFKYLNAKTGTGEVKLNYYQFKGHFQTLYNIYLNTTYWMASTDGKGLFNSKSVQKGNPVGEIGFNWLEFGRKEERIALDILAGISFRETGSELASSRLDQYYGAQTFKRFYDFVLAIGYKVYLTGRPRDVQEMDIGNMNQITATLGWQATGNIRFLLEGTSLKVKEGNEEESRFRLSENISIGYLKLGMELGISPLINLRMGATFRTQKTKNELELEKAKLWGMEGIYGNSLTAGVNITI